MFIKSLQFLFILLKSLKNSQLTILWSHVNVTEAITSRCQNQDYVRKFITPIVYENFTCETLITYSKSLPASLAG